MDYTLNNVKHIDYFWYNGVTYGKDTKVTFTDDFIKNHKCKGKKIFKYAIFMYREKDENGKLTHCFINDTSDWDRCAKYGMKVSTLKEFCNTIEIDDFVLSDKIIEKITEPVVVDVSMPKPKKDWEDKDVILGWIVCIFALIGVLIIPQGFLLWPIIYVVFTIWRNKKLGR